jgi:hypothetical protein
MQEEPLVTPGEQPAKKPSSARRIAASQENGRKSRGPRTLAGRLKCSNAAKSQFKHNMLAESVLLTGESRPRFTELLQNYIDTFKPLSEPEHNVIQKMVVAHWRQIRAWSTLQTNINCEIARQDETLPHPLRASSAELAMNQQGNILALASRYETAFDRQFKSAMRDLELLRRLRGSTTGINEVPVPVASSTWEHPDDEES